MKVAFQNSPRAGTYFYGQMHVTSQTAGKRQLHDVLAKLPFWKLNPVQQKPNRAAKNARMAMQRHFNYNNVYSLQIPGQGDKN